MIYLISRATFVTYTLCFKFVLSLIDPIIGTRLYAINFIKFSKKKKKKKKSHIYLINLTLKLLSALINVSITTKMINVFNDEPYLTSVQCFL